MVEIFYRADLHRPIGWTISGWRRAWRRGYVHTAAGRRTIES